MLEHTSTTGVETDAPLGPRVSSELIKSVYEALDERGLIAYGQSIPVSLLRQLAGIDEPTINGLMSPMEIRTALKRDDLAMLALTRGIADRHLLKQGMAWKQREGHMIIPRRSEMPKVWESYATKAANALNRARWLIKTAPAQTGEDMAYAQQQAARVARQVAKLSTEAANIVH